MLLDCNGIEVHRGNGGFKMTTNNRMELYGVLKGLNSIRDASRVLVKSDSKYVVYGISRWIRKWVRTDYDGKKNRDLWEGIWRMMNYHTVSSVWVKGHNGNKYNEIADSLASCGGSILNDLSEDIGYDASSKGFYGKEKNEGRFVRRGDYEKAVKGNITLEHRLNRVLIIND